MQLTDHSRPHQGDGDAVARFDGSEVAAENRARLKRLPVGQVQGAVPI